MAIVCEKCGASHEDGAKFCVNCGAPLGASSPSVNAGDRKAARQGIPAPGFSDRVNDPEILAAVRKSRKTAAVFAFFLVPLPLLGFVIYSFVSDKMETAQALKFGAIISGVFLLFALYGFLKERAKNTYDATVIEKRTRRDYNRNDSSESYRTEYITVVRTDAGKKKKIVEREGSRLWAWEYLPVGDRFRYHPQFSFPYEKYDKSTAPYIACVSCQTKNPVESDRCSKCGLPLLK